MPTVLIDLLTASPVFAALSRDERKQLDKSGVIRSYRRDETIVHYGDVWPYLFIVLGGTIEGTKLSSEGRSLQVATFGIGDIFWGMAFFHVEARMPVQLLVREDCQISRWSRQDILPILLANGAFSWELARLMITHMQRASGIVEGLAFQPVAGRVARLLLEQTPALQQGLVPRNLTLDEMAARVGTTREVVCRFLHRFVDEGLIDITRTEFFIHNRDGLEDVAQQMKG